MKIVWLRRAERSLEAIADYIAQDNPKAAYTMLNHIRRAAGKLADMPAVGRPGRVAGTRELMVLGTPYILAYRITEQTIQILHILHGRQRWPEVFDE